MSIEIKYFENRKEWREWLAANFETANEIWFVFPANHRAKKALHTTMLSKKPSVSNGLTVQ